MKQLLFTVIIFISMNAVGQKDFDYTVYTNNLNVTETDSVATPLKVTLFRQIKKEANVIKIISLVNTGDAETYHIRYVGGWNEKAGGFFYQTDEGMEILVNPILPTVIVIDRKRRVKQTYH